MVRMDTDVAQTRERDVLRALKDAIADRGVSPTLRELAAATGMSFGQTQGTMNRLIASGAVVSTPGAKRSWRPAQHGRCWMCGHALD